MVAPGGRSWLEWAGAAVCGCGNEEEVEGRGGAYYVTSHCWYNGCMILRIQQGVGRGPGGQGARGERGARARQLAYRRKVRNV